MGSYYLSPQVRTSAAFLLSEFWFSHHIFQPEAFLAEYLAAPLRCRRSDMNTMNTMNMMNMLTRPILPAFFAPRSILPVLFAFAACESCPRSFRRALFSKILFHHPENTTDMLITKLQQVRTTFGHYPQSRTPVFALPLGRSLSLSTFRFFFFFFFFLLCSGHNNRSALKGLPPVSVAERAFSPTGRQEHASQEGRSFRSCGRWARHSCF
ncbi:hypothetical protein L209DRAFT_771689, partial [Thermothelomyces heterothallicus CBS 203.75]